MRRMCHVELISTVPKTLKLAMVSVGSGSTNSSNSIIGSLGIPITYPPTGPAWYPIKQSVPRSAKLVISFQESTNNLKISVKSVHGLPEGNCCSYVVTLSIPGLEKRWETEPSVDSSWQFHSPWCVPVQLWKTNECTLLFSVINSSTCDILGQVSLCPRDVNSETKEYSLFPTNVGFVYAELLVTEKMKEIPQFPQGHSKIDLSPTDTRQNCSQLSPSGLDPSNRPRKPSRSLNSLNQTTLKPSVPNTKPVPSPKLPKSQDLSGNSSLEAKYINLTTEFKIQERNFERQVQELHRQCSRLKREKKQEILKNQKLKEKLSKLLQANTMVDAEVESSWEDEMSFGTSSCSEDSDVLSLGSDTDRIGDLCKDFEASEFTRELSPSSSLEIKEGRSSRSGSVTKKVGKFLEKGHDMGTKSRRMSTGEEKKSESVNKSTSDVELTIAVEEVPERKLIRRLSRRKSDKVKKH
eukprot:TRINITY_DN10135_c0_g1_i10.p1 TRINITY_DN10135_c0_g1~~TRINITY_DN10135_c0_g1_i10.p1  ORF type:complete len:466 (+),score=113.22 TRINITY_DN10135_c0_g1_i10:145-1542(+)